MIDEVALFQHHQKGGKISISLLVLPNMESADADEGHTQGNLSLIINALVPGNHSLELR